MPEVSRFFGIAIKMHFDEHPPPHFHAEYNEYKAVVDIRSVTVIGGYLPPRALGLVVEWAVQHRSELLALWDRAAKMQPLGKIAPLT